MSDDKDIYDRYADVCGRANAIAERLEIAEADRIALIGALAELIAYVRNVGGFMFPEEQATLRRATAVLTEAQRR